MRKLVNLQASTCSTPACALPDQSDVEVVYGPAGPAGEIGAQGTPGADGRNAFTNTTSAFSMPAVGVLAAVQVLDNRSFTVGQRAYIAGVGDFEVTAKTSTTQLTLRNLGGIAAIPAGSLVGSGLRVTSGSQPGPDTAGNTPKRHAIVGHVMDQGEDGGPMQIQMGAGAAAQGAGAVYPLEVVSDPDSIIQIFGVSLQNIRLPIGAWKIHVRVPAYYCKAFQAYLLEQPDEDGNEFVGGGTKIAKGNGYAGIDSDGADPQRHAYLNVVWNNSDPDKYLQIFVRQQSWSFARSEPTKSRALGVASDFDDGAGNPVDELFTVMEIEEL